MTRAAWLVLSAHRITSCWKRQSREEELLDEEMVGEDVSDGGATDSGQSCAPDEEPSFPGCAPAEDTRPLADGSCYRRRESGVCPVAGACVEVWANPCWSVGWLNCVELVGVCEQASP